MTLIRKPFFSREGANITIKNMASLILGSIGFRRNRVYIRIRREWLSVRLITYGGAGHEFAGMSRVLLDHRIKGPATIGDEARDAFEYDHGVTMYTAFNHPRAIISGFDVALVVLRQFLIKVNSDQQYLCADAVIQVIEPLEGGITDVEARTLKELAMRGSTPMRR